MTVVSNTSPLLNLALIDRVHLIEAQFGEVVIPTAVWNELTEIRGESLALQGGDEADQQYSTADDGIDGVSNAIINPSDRDSMHRW